MKVHVDLIHPANYHYFKYFIANMTKNGHDVVITARNKDVMISLLEYDNVQYENLGKGSIGSGAIGKMLYLVYATSLLFFQYLKNRPDIVISFNSLPCALNAFLFRLPHISFDDTEHTSFNRKLVLPFTDLICTPSAYQLDLGKKHFRFNSMMELFYLNKVRFEPDKNVLKEAGIGLGEKYIVIRFVSWEAYHDIGIDRISTEEKIKLVLTLAKEYKVIVSAEGGVPDELEPYRMKIKPSYLHDIIGFSSLYIGEGGTTASECAVLGVPAIYINNLPLMGYLETAQNHGLLYHIKDYHHILNKAREILNEDIILYKKRQNILTNDTIEPTNFLVWLVENYPRSRDTIINNPEFQKTFLIKE
jgi:predicted glycosyltransferase